MTLHELQGRFRAMFIQSFPEGSDILPEGALTQGDITAFRRFLRAQSRKAEHKLAAACEELRDLLYTVEQLMLQGSWVRQVGLDLDFLARHRIW